MKTKNNLVKGTLLCSSQSGTKKKNISFTKKDFFELIDQKTLNVTLKEFVPQKKSVEFINTLSTINNIINFLSSKYKLSFAMVVGSFLVKEEFNDIDLLIVTKDNIQNPRDLFLYEINRSKIPNPNKVLFDIIVYTDRDFFEKIVIGDFRVITLFLEGKFLIYEKFWYLTRERLKKTNFDSNLFEKHSEQLFTIGNQMIKYFGYQIKTNYYSFLFQGVMNLVHSYLFSQNITEFSNEKIIAGLKFLKEKNNDERFNKLYELVNNIIDIKGKINLNKELSYEEFKFILQVFYNTNEIMSILTDIVFFVNEREK